MRQRARNARGLSPSRRPSDTGASTNTRGQGTQSAVHKKDGTGRSGLRWRPFLSATVVFVLVVVSYSLFSPRVNRVVAPVTEEDVSLLRETIERVAAQPSITSMDSLTQTALHTACTLELMLEQLVEAEDGAEKEATGVEGAHEKHQQRQQQGPSHVEHKAAAGVLQRYERQLDVSVPVLARAADTLYATLLPMLLVREGRPLPEALRSLPRTGFSWLSATTHVYSTVMTEYSLLRDDSPAHARSLLRSVNLLSFSTNFPNLFNWTGAPCGRAHPTTVTKQWLYFCETSLSSRQATLTRRAASFEELVALYPHFAPFRLHYAALLLVTDKPFGSQSSRLRVLRAQQEKLDTYQAVDAEHRPMLTVLEAFVTPEEHIRSDTRTALGTILRHELSTCSAFVGHPLSSPASDVRVSADPTENMWPAPFQAEVRPPLFDRKQFTLLLAKLQVVLGPDFPPGELTGGCM